MKLYYSPGACSLSPHIALREAGLSFDLALASTKTKKLADGSDFLAINPKGQVPALQLDGGEVLTEGPAIVQYIADQAPASGLAPAAGTLARYRLMEWLNFITSELHKSFSPLFTPGTSDDAKAAAKARLMDRLGWVDTQLAGKDYLMGEQLHRRRRLPVHRHQLDQLRRHGHLRPAQPGRLHGPRGRAPEGAGGPEG